MVVLIVHMKVKPGTEAECIRLMRLLEENTRKESGCIQYVGHQSQDDPTRFAFYESYVSESALHLHWGSEHFKHYVTEGLDKIVDDRSRHLMVPIS